MLEDFILQIISRTIWDWFTKQRIVGILEIKSQIFRTTKALPLSTGRITKFWLIWRYARTTFSFLAMLEKEGNPTIVLKSFSKDLSFYAISSCGQYTLDIQLIFQGYGYFYFKYIFGFFESSPSSLSPEQICSA